MGLVLLIAGVTLLYYSIKIMKNRETPLLINCKVCGKEISSKVNLCPHCGTKQKSNTKKIIIGIISFFIIINFIDSFKNNFVNNLEKAKAEKYGEPVEKSIKDIIVTNKFEISIESLEKKDSVGSNFYKLTPAEGGEYIAVVWKYKNITDKPINALNFPRLVLIDGNGTEYSHDLEATTNYSMEVKRDAKIFSDLNPGITVTDVQVFEIGKDKFNFDNWKILLKSDKNMKLNLK